MYTVSYDEEFDQWLVLSPEDGLAVARFEYEEDAREYSYNLSVYDD